MCRTLVVYPASAMVGLLLFNGVNQAPPSVRAEHQLANADHGSASASGVRAGRTPANDVPTAPGAGGSTVREAGFVVRTAEAAVPATVFDAYQRAAGTMATQSPDCHLSWSLLAGIGKVESDNAGDGDVAPNGALLRPILGPVLDGSAGTAAVPNTVGTAWGQSGQWERAVGPMQFLPSTWQRWGVDGNGDLVADPNNIYDASLAAARYLCSGGGNLSMPAGLDNAIFSYNHSAAYVAEVLRWMSIYQTGGAAVPDDPAAADVEAFDPPASAGQAETVPPSAQGVGNPPSRTSSPPPASSPQPKPPTSQQPTPAPPNGPTPPASGPVGQVLTDVKNLTGVLLPASPVRNTLTALLP